jgi:hypothetical protein
VPSILIAVDSLTMSLTDSGVLELEVSEVLGISLSEVHALYFRGIYEVRRDRIMEEAMDCWFEEKKRVADKEEYHQEFLLYQEDTIF